jgi:hypothetical protein
VPRVESRITTSIIGKSSERAFQWYKEFPNCKSDAHDMSSRVQNQTSDIDCKKGTILEKFTKKPT